VADTAITRACGLLARAWESESDPLNTELGVTVDTVRQMSVDAQLEEDQLRKDLKAAQDEIERLREWSRELGLLMEELLGAVLVSSKG